MSPMTQPEPYAEGPTFTLYQGDALAVLASLPTGSVDAVVTDPPYSSGGMVRSDRAGQSTVAKFTTQNTRADELADFSGDNRDQRGYAYWSALWLGEALRVTRPGGVVLMFCDWRQLPVTTDALGVAEDLRDASRPPGQRVDALVYRAGVRRTDPARVIGREAGHVRPVGLRSARRPPG